MISGITCYRVFAGNRVALEFVAPMARKAKILELGLPA